MTGKGEHLVRVAIIEDIDFLGKEQQGLLESKIKKKVKNIRTEIFDIF
jgi:hypothetical protein